MFDFDTLVSREGTDSLKWDLKPGELPMWVADMDFVTAPAIRKTIENRIANGIFGYTIVPDAWAEAYTRWWQCRHGFEMQKDWLIFCTGAVPAISSMVRKLTTPNENVLLLTPVYNIFFNSIINNGCRPLECPLKLEGTDYSIDFAALEEGLANEQTTLMILCNPHNPVGRIWTRDELKKIGELCHKYHVTVISDELHCELVAPGEQYTPFAAVNDTCRSISVTCISPSKTFNLAGLQGAAVCVADPFLRHKVWRALNTDEVAEPNILACISAVVAFTEGKEWLEELRAILWRNRAYAVEQLKQHVPQAVCIPALATYLLWLDCRNITSDTEALAGFIRRETGLVVTEGDEYGLSGKGFLRINLACPMPRLKDGIARLCNGLNAFIAKGND